MVDRGRNRCLLTTADSGSGKRLEGAVGAITDQQYIGFEVRTKIKANSTEQSIIATDSRRTEENPALLIIKVLQSAYRVF